MTCTVNKDGKSCFEQCTIGLLARADPKLLQVFYGTVACDRLLSLVNQEGPTAYIVNTDATMNQEDVG